MSKNPIRRSQLIAPFGIGAMLVVQRGVGYITAGLDHWFKRDSDGKLISPEELEEFQFEEWRLQRILGVDHFRLPPDYREGWAYDGSVPNQGLSIPFQRFPQWHFCPRCDRLEEYPLHERKQPKCPECKITMFQVPFVAMCAAGHLQDFPWREWVHRQINPTCKGTLRLKATGSASLSGQKISCDECGRERNLASIMYADIDGSTFLSKHLVEDSDTIFYCPGHRPWLGKDAQEKCNAHVRGSLRSASNVYFAHVYSSIFLPTYGQLGIPNELVELFSNPPISTLLKILLDSDATIASVITSIRKAATAKLIPFPDELLTQAIELYRQEHNEIENRRSETKDIDTNDEEFRQQEYQVLTREIEEASLTIRQADLGSYDTDIVGYFRRIMLIDRLQETRAFAGFTRVHATNDQPLAHRLSMLRKNPAKDGNWLPAYKVYGEGIFFEFDEEQLRIWEQTPQIQARINKLNSRLNIQSRSAFDGPEITPRFVLLHTFAHILMNRLTFECGYSSAALKERLYVSTDANFPMSGVLIYTADGDADGTLGGLVRMGKAGYIEPVIQRALLDATWCSVDPVCSEIGESGQGPDSCNLAACHNCALVPETACEHFNRFLDRVVVVGDFEHPEIGYFNIR